MKLKNNDYVYGKFAKKGSTFTFPIEEAKKRLAETDKWEIS